MPDVPFTSRFGYRAGSMSGSLRVSSKFRRKGTVSFSMSRSISSASGAMRASVYRMAAALSPSMEPKLPWPSTSVPRSEKGCAMTDQRVVHRRVSVRMIFTKAVADDARALAMGFVGRKAPARTWYRGCAAARA